MNCSFLTVPVSVEGGTFGSTYGVHVRSSWHTGAPKHDDRVTRAVWQPSQTACAVWLGNAQWNMDQPRLLPFTGHLPSRCSCQTHTYSQTHVTGCPLIGTICNFNSMCLRALFEFYKCATQRSLCRGDEDHTCLKFVTTHYNQRIRDSAVGVATSYLLDNRGVGVWVPVGSRIFSTSSRPALGSTEPPIQWVPGAVSLGGIAAGAWSWPLTYS
jgi:hypothetical protein